MYVSKMIIHEGGLPVPVLLGAASAPVKQVPFFQFSSLTTSITCGTSIHRL